MADKIKKILKEHPEGLKAREIADAIPGTDRRAINQILYGTLKKECTQDKDYRWHLKSITLEEPDKPGSDEIKPNPQPRGITEDIVCPKCGAPMVRRTAQRGYNRGGEFWGCSNYPKCKGTRSIKQGDNPSAGIKLVEPDKPIIKPKRPKSVKFCEECLIFLNNECDGKGNPNSCPAYKFGG